MKKTILIIVLIIVVVGIAVILMRQSTTPPVKNDFAHVPADSELSNNLSAAGLDALSTEGTVLHIHQHLDIMVNGNAVVVPAQVGIGSSFISPIHTHDTSGILHVESPVQKDFKLGQFFKEWGIDFTNSCIGTNCADDSHKLIVAVNGSPISDGPNYVLKAHDEIEVWYGPKTENPTLIKSYAFDPSL